jgi:hypothetical protein
VFDPADVNDFQVEGANGSSAGAVPSPVPGSIPSSAPGAISPAAAAPIDGSIRAASAAQDGPATSDGPQTASPAIVDALPSEPAVRSDGTAELRAAAESAPDLAGPFTKRDLQHISDQIVFRDYKLIAQSDIVVVFYDALVPSPGVISEMNYALQTGKRVYGVWLPASPPSPFFTRYCTRVFAAADDLFDYFDRHDIAVPREPSTP